MDLPHYGQAEKELRKAGMWKLNKRERVEVALMDLDRATDMVQDSLDDIQNAMEAFP